MLIHEMLPCEAIEFDENARALEDFSTLIIGFGKIGQVAFRQVVMNSQFCGSHFSAVVVNVDAEDVSQQFMRRYAGLMGAYDIEFHSTAIHSPEFSALLKKIAARLKYVVVCLDSEDLSQQVAGELEPYFARTDGTHQPVIVVSDGTHFFSRQQKTFTNHTLSHNELEQMAMLVWFSYNEHIEKSEDMLKLWQSVESFQRESCRASANFIPAMLYMAGIAGTDASDAKLFAKRIAENEQLLESLSITEHLRWNAFHYAMGYTKMQLEEIEQRALQGIKPVQKDVQNLRHACLVDWDELDDLSRVVGRLTNNPSLDYKEMDRTNVKQIPRTLSV